MLIVLLTCILFFTPIVNANTYYQSIAKQEMLRHGEMAYQRRCSGCHGEKGDGLGPAAKFLSPKPRNFTTGIYKFRTTPLGKLPTDEDMMKVISQGIYGTSMPSFSLVPEQERFSIVQYLKTFSNRFEDPAYLGTPVVGSPMPLEDFLDHEKFIVRAKKGRALFVEACALCHGSEGRGDGFAGVDLVDEWGDKILPADFSKLSIKSGKAVEDIYRTLLTGIDGTPMPAFNETYSADQLWDLSAYVLYLRGAHHKIYEDKLPLEPIQKSEYE